MGIAAVRCEVLLGPSLWPGVPACPSCQPLIGIVAFHTRSEMCLESASGVFVDATLEKNGPHGIIR